MSRISILRLTFAVVAAALVGVAAVPAIASESVVPVMSTSTAPPVSVSIAGDFTFHACPAGSPAADACLTDHVVGTLPEIGDVTGLFEVHIAFSQSAADGCGPIDKDGVFTTTTGATTHLRATGVYCSTAHTAAYEYAVVGGTGALRHAGGHGLWLVPPPVTFTGSAGTGPEFLYGTLRAGNTVR